MHADYVGMTIEERIAAAEAELKLYKAGLVGIHVTPTEPGEPEPTPTAVKPTVTIVNRGQHMRVAGLHPASQYSRVLVVHAAAAGGGVWGYGFSQSFGKESRVLQIKATVQLVPGGAVERSYFSIHCGTGMPTRRQDVEAWDRVIDFGTYAGTHGMVVHGTFRQFSWELTKLFTARSHRFGVLFYNSSTNTGVVHVFYKLSEG